VTLTYAQSLDSSLALAPGVRTALSGQETKAMTHYLRSVHDAILVGAGTAVADDPGLNCRLEEAIGDPDRQPRPVVLDPNGRWDRQNSECLKQAKAGKGKEPWILDKKTVGDRQPPGIWPELGDSATIIPWQTVFRELYERGIRSVMVEGGGVVINSLLSEQNIALVDSVIITIAPTWLGQGGVVVSPPRSAETNATAKLTETRWQQFGEDVVLCGRVQQSDRL
jgi:2,5-diamino-6-(ribosylamino)-4(3H)-pyrimidinone 5'-phosphate reductase